MILSRELVGIMDYFLLTRLNLKIDVGVSMMRLISMFNVYIARSISLTVTRTYLRNLLVVSLYHHGWYVDPPQWSGYMIFEVRDPQAEVQT